MTNQITRTTAIATRPCMFCHETSVVDVSLEEAEAIEAGVPIQAVLPDVEPATRELLISGIHPSCWAGAFG